MPSYKLSAANGQGTLAEARRLHVSDGGGIRGAAGLLQPAAKAWAFSEVSGRFEQMWPNGPSINSFNVTMSADGDWKKTRFTWDASGGGAWSVSAGSQNMTYGVSGETSWDYSYPSGADAVFPAYIQPGMTVVFTLLVQNLATYETATATAIRTMPVIPPPNGIIASAVTSTTARLTISVVPGADAYTLQKQVSGSWVQADYSPSNVFDVVLDPGSTTVWRALAHWFGYTSAPSSTRTVEAPLGGAFGPGSYLVPPYAYGSVNSAGSWNPPSPQCLVGSNPYGSDAFSAYVFYRTNISELIPSGFNGRTLTRLEMYVQRLGSDRDAILRLVHSLHGYSTQPVGTPLYTDTTTTPLVDFTAAQGAWVQLPLTWGNALAVGNPWRGVTIIAEGNPGGAWGIIESDLNASIPTGTLRFTVS